MKRLGTGVVDGALAVTLAFGLVACGGDHGAPRSTSDGVAASTSESQPSPKRRSSRFEQRFLTGMIDHHHMAVMMAETCVAEAEHDELRELCSAIITAQNAEIEHMQHWLSEWFGITHEPEMTPEMERQTEELAALEGEAFEIAFMVHMIGHHLTALEEGGMCLARAYHPELVGMCGEMVGSQAGEIVQMRGWLCEWYERCGPIDGGPGAGHGCGMHRGDGMDHGGGMGHGAGGTGQGGETDHGAGNGGGGMAGGEGHGGSMGHGG